MGSATSRGKRVAPECVGEVRGTKPGAAEQDGGPFRRLRVHGALRNARSRAQPDSEGRDSDVSEDDEARGLECDPKTAPKRTFIGSKTYGLCHFGQEEEEEEEEEEEAGPRVAHRASKDGNKTQHTPEGFIQHNSQSSSQTLLARGTLLENGPTSEKQPTSDSCHSSPVTTPVILYDGSEEELMDTIEREFS